jgi:hypothetical protein
VATEQQSSLAHLPAHFGRAPLFQEPPLVEVAPSFSRAFSISVRSFSEKNGCHFTWNPSAWKSRATASSYFCVRRFQVHWITLMVTVSPSSAVMYESFGFGLGPSHQNF